MAYKTSFKNQNWILPPMIKEMIPENHICFFIEEFVESLDFSEFEMVYEGAGAPAYIVTFYNKKLKKKKDVPFYFCERLKMRDKMETF